jgi:hypothetical protein
MVYSIKNIGKEEKREPSLTHREKHVIIEKEPYISDSIPRQKMDERPPQRENFNKFTITNYEYKNKNFNSSFENKEDSMKRSRNRLPSNKHKNSLSRNNNSYLSDFNDTPNLVGKDFGTAHYDNKFDIEKAQTERLYMNTNNFREEIKTETSQTAELVDIYNLGKTDC